MFRYITYKKGYKPSRTKELEYQKILEKAVLEAYVTSQGSSTKDSQSKDDKKFQVAE